jgi:DNA-binding transcriptional regulator YbjK
MTVRREKIAQGVITVLAETGISGLTHRAVAQAARVPLAATTYYFATKANMLAEASERLLGNYISSFERLAANRDVAANGEGPEGLALRLVANSAGRHRRTSIA